ncbi:hypothetical protein [Glaciecola petra]|uniref:Uncharacterized protein n=1 Tax=Glaciecola petra TaxID=3075602 RepID=A0ABU2ZPX0_9ALTE|nr:hypothetical protein [Aestuariibacter sp. P117]MDT0594098.1 hypothetical protein [Aestuariibacter sp. P117]
MKAQRISDKAPILCHPAVVFVIIYVLTAIVILTGYDLSAVAVCSFIGFLSITLASILRELVSCNYLLSRK